MKKGNPRLPCMILRKKKIEYIIFILPQKDQKELAKKRSSLFLPVLLLNYHSYSSSFYCRVYCLQKRYFTEFRFPFSPCCSCSCLLGTQQSVMFLTARDSKGQQRHNFDLHTSPRNEPITYKSNSGFHWGWKEMKKKKRVKKERQVLDRLQKKEWRLRHLLRRNPSPP